MSGRRKNKRQRTMSNEREGQFNGKRTKTDDEDKQANVQRSRRRQNHSASSVNIEVTINASNDAKDGRALRPRAENPAHSDVEDNSADESYNPLTRLTKAQKSAKNRKLEQYFNCTEQGMEEFFAGIGVSVYFQNPPPPIPCEQVHTHNEDCVRINPRIIASNVTQELLAFYAAWTFADANSLVQQEASTLTAADIYKPISLIASPILWDTAPFTLPTEREDGTFKLDKDQKPDRDIRAAWWWFRRRLMLGLPLKFPLEWTYADESLPSERPEMPNAFSKLLKEERLIHKPPKSTCSSLDGTPLKKSAGTLLANNVAVKPLSLSIIQEQDESISPSFAAEGIPSTSHLTSESSTASDPTFFLPYFELESVPPSDAVDNDQSTECESSGIEGLSNLPAAQANRESDGPRDTKPKHPPTPAKFELAYSLINRHGLKETKEDALRLGQYLAGPQRMFDINQSKKQLCSLLGPPEKHTVLDGNFTGRDFAFVPRAEIEKEDELERCGNAGKTENAIDVGDTAMEINFRWLNFKGINEAGLPGKGGLSELDIERRVGSLFVGLFRFAELQESANMTTRFLRHIQLFSTSPRPDYAVRPATGEWSHWPDNLRPIVASGDKKPPKSMCRDNEAQLAFNTRPLIILQILMYLDTRQTANAPLPGWMFNLSWIVNHRGFTVYAHYPSVKLGIDGKKWSWKMVSVKLTDIYDDVWAVVPPAMTLRMQAKSAFDMIVSHTSFVLDQIRGWSRVRGCYGEGSIMNRLIARAHMEEGDYEWLHRKMEEEKAKAKEEGTASEGNI